MNENKEKKTAYFSLSNILKSSLEFLCAIITKTLKTTNKMTVLLIMSE